MSNYIEYDDKIAFHPGYYIKEIVEDNDDEAFVAITEVSEVLKKA